MFLMSDESEIMRSDEVLRCRAYNKTLGEGVVIVEGKRVYDLEQADEFDFRCNVQPTTGDDLILQPEGDRFDEQLIIYVPSNQDRVPDVNDLIYRDNWYQVQANEYWGSYGRLRIQRVDVGPDRALGA